MLGFDVTRWTLTLSLLAPGAFDFSEEASRTRYKYAAFYADCYHELKLIADGARVCLVFNLVNSGQLPSS